MSNASKKSTCLSVVAAVAVAMMACVVSGCGSFNCLKDSDCQAGEACLENWCALAPAPASVASDGGVVPIEDGGTVVPTEDGGAPIEPIADGGEPINEDGGAPAEDGGTVIPTSDGGEVTEDGGAVADGGEEIPPADGGPTNDGGEVPAEDGGVIITEDGGPVGPAVGTEGGPCYFNGTCNDGLSCHSNLCVWVPPGPSEGQEGGACYPNDTCNDGLSCRSNLCVWVPSVADGGAVEDGGPIADGGMAVDGGEVTSDGGVVADGGTLEDGGIVTDGGVVIDGGVTLDGGNIIDGGVTMDGGVLDGGQPCPQSCPGIQVCVNGACRCPQGFTLCGDICVSLSIDSDNCGTCGNACADLYGCQASQCVRTHCEPSVKVGDKVFNYTVPVGMPGTHFVLRGVRDWELGCTFQNIPGTNVSCILSGDTDMAQVAFFTPAADGGVATELAWNCNCWPQTSCWSVSPLTADNCPLSGYIHEGYEAQWTEQWNGANCVKKPAATP